MTHFYILSSFGILSGNAYKMPHNKEVFMPLCRVS